MITPNFKTTFDLNDTSGTFLKMFLEDITDYQTEGINPANVTAYFKISAPNYPNYYNGQYDLPDLTGTAKVYPAIFGGGALNDMISGGAYTGSNSSFFEIVIESVGAVDKFKWKKGSTGTYTMGNTITGNAQTLSDGVTVKFGATSGHNIGDSWTVQVRPAGTIFKEIDIPVDTLGDPLEGDYEITMVVTVTGSVQPGTYEKTKTINYCGDFPGTPSLSFLVDCFCFTITATDITKYGNPIKVARKLTVSPPKVSGDPDVTVNTPSLKYNFRWTNSNYEFSLDTTLTYEYPNDFIVLEHVHEDFNKFVDCDYDLCGLMKCFNEYTTEFQNEACRLGGEKNMSPGKVAEYLSLVGLIELHLNLVKCGKFKEAEERYCEIKKILDCKCCSSTEEGPVLVNPYCGGSDGVDFEFLANTPLKVSRDGNTITYYLDQAFIDKINALGGTSTTTAINQMDYRLVITHNNTFPFLHFEVKDLVISGTRHKSPSHQHIDTYISVQELNTKFFLFNIYDFRLQGISGDKIHIETAKIQLGTETFYGTLDNSKPEELYAKVRGSMAGNPDPPFTLRVLESETDEPIYMQKYLSHFDRLEFFIKITE